MDVLSSTLKLFFCSIPFLFFLGILSKFSENSFIGLWIFSPYDYPFSFTLAVGISLCCSAWAIWIYRERERDFNPFLICLSICAGCFFRLCINPAPENFFRFMLIFTIILIPVFFILPLIFFYTPPVLFLALTCFLQQSKPTKRTRRLFYAGPAIILILLISFATFDGDRYLSPGLSFPMSFRNFFGNLQFNSYYKEAVGEVKKCPLILNAIGQVEAVALAEGKNEHASDFDGENWAVLTLEILGKKGTAIIKGCKTDKNNDSMGINFCSLEKLTEQPQERSKFSRKRYFGQCEEENE
jgi:hypothetical protein